MNNKLKRSIKAAGLVIGVYGLLVLLAVGILSIPKERAGDIFTGTVLAVSTYFMYRAALDYIEWKEREKGDSIL
jgi:hypothetical protein